MNFVEHSPKEKGATPPVPDFQAFFESAPGAFLVLLPDDPRFTIVAASDAYLQLVKVKREKVLNRGVFEAFPANPNDLSGDGIESLRDSFLRVIATCASDQTSTQRYDVERPIPEGSGFEERYWRILNQPILSADGRVAYIFNAVEEVTEKIRADERILTAKRELRASEMRFRQLAEASTLGLAIADLEGRLLYLNPTLQALLGYNEEEVATGLVRWDRITPPQFASIDAEAVRQLTTVGRCAPFEKAYIAKDGRHVPILVGVSLLDSLSGRKEAAAFILDLTERKRIERERQRLVSVVENAGDFIGISDLDAMPIYVNQAGLKLVGARDLEECRNTPVIEYFVPEDRAFVGETVLPAVAEHGQWSGELRFRHFRTGEAIPVLYDVFRVDDPDTGEAINFATVTRDIREQKRAEQRAAFLLKLDDATRPLTDPHEITETAARLLGEHLGADRCVYCYFEADEETLHITGEYTRSGVAGMKGRYRLSQFDREAARLLRANLPHVVEDCQSDPCLEDVRESYRQAGICGILGMPLHKAGRLAAAMAVHQGTPRKWQADEIELVLQVANRCWESIERAHVALELQTSEQRLRLAQRAGRTGTFEWLMQEKRILWTPELESLYGMPEGSFEGKLEDWSKRVAPEDAQRVIDGITDCVGKRQTEYDYEFQVLLPNGTRRWLSAQSQFFYDMTGAPVRMVGINTDVDARKKAEAERERSLAAAAASNRELQKANRELEEFAYVASHDLQEPLRTVSIYTQLLLRELGGGSSRVEQYAEFIRQGVSRMEELIRDLLTVSRTIYDNRPPEGTALLQEALAKASSVLESPLQESGAIITAEALPTVKGDPQQLSLVFENLLSNSLKYRKQEEPPRIHIAAAQESDGWVISFRDNGIGFDQRYAERIFGLFKRLHKDEYPGTGLGLAICQRIVERHGGRMWAQSRLGEGATFYFSLPFAE